MSLTTVFLVFTRRPNSRLRYDTTRHDTSSIRNDTAGRTPNPLIINNHTTHDQTFLLQTGPRAEHIWSHDTEANTHTIMKL
jgi:hypothetical protein